MEIELNQIGKKFRGEWLFKNINHLFAANSATALVGYNGSGKSTLLQLILGYQMPSAGKITYALNGNLLTDQELYNHTVFVAPYLELPEELTLTEVIEFHFKIKQRINQNPISVLISSAGLGGSENKQLKYFSSGMKQRVKLLLAVNTKASLLLLDEPCSNLDAQGMNWYQELMVTVLNHRTIIVASNLPAEYGYCHSVLDITVFK